MADLTRKQQRFIAEYLLDLNATQAAIRAGYGRKNAKQQGTENLAKPSIVAEIDKAIAERAERTGIAQDAVVEELKRLATSDLRDYSEWGPDGVYYFPSDEIDPEAARALSEVSMVKERRYDKHGDVIETVNVKLKAHDKKGALELLGRHLGMFKDNLSISSDRPLEIRVRGLRSNAGGSTPDSP